MTLAWAVRHPDKLSAWAGIYPVCNLASYPLRFSKNETLADYGMDEKELRAKLGELNPVENLAVGDGSGFGRKSSRFRNRRALTR